MKTNLEIFRNPWRELTSLQRRMDRLFEDLGTSPMRAEAGEEAFLPACDIEEKENQYLISVDVPGIPKDEIKVEVWGNTLTISGEHKEERKEEKGKRTLMERYQGRFERSFTLPEMANAEKIEANYKDGVLSVTIPRETAARSRRIQIGEGKSAPVKIHGKSEEKKENKPSETRAA